MDKLKMMSANIVDENIEKIGALFPNCITERIVDGKVVRAIDFDVLKQELSDVVVEGREERYQFTWPDKKNAVRLANETITATLRPCREESVDFDTTENIYINGDNLDVLRVIRESYLGKVKVIYIDPPYNTGNNLIYKNDFSMSVNEYLANSGQFTDQGIHMVLNPESNGRFHTDWLNMMYARLKVAKDLLKEDGYIAIAIDDNEVYNLKKIADEIFGEFNYIGTIITRCNPQGRNKNNIDPVHEYHLIYAKNIIEMPLLRIKKEKKEKEYGYLMRSGTNSRKHERPYRYYPMLVKDNKVSVIEPQEYAKIYSPKTGFDEKYILELKNKYEQLGYIVVFPVSKDGEDKVWQRVYDRVKDECVDYIYDKGQIKVPAENDRTPMSLWADEKYSNVAYGTNRLKTIFGNESPFDFSKSVFTVKDIISLNSSKDDIILDFFPGSATTADAVMKLNVADGGKRRFIMIQLPEIVEENTAAYRMGYRTICDIGKERIRKSAKIIENENPLAKFDGGFRNLILDSSNMKDVYYNPSDFEQSALDDFVSNIKEDRTAEDLLFQVMLDLGVLLSSKIEETVIAGKKVFNVADNFLVACFDENITDDVITQIAKQQPYYFVMRDNSMSSDSTATNFEQIFATYSPSTERKVL